MSHGVRSLKLRAKMTVLGACHISRHLTRISSPLCWEALGASLDKLPEGEGLLRQKCFSDEARGIISLHGKIFSSNSS